MVFPELREFIESFNFCKAFGADMAAPANDDEMQQFKKVALDNLKDQVKPSSTRAVLLMGFLIGFKMQVCDRISLGWSDMFSEGTYVNVNSYLAETTKVDPLPDEMNSWWGPGEPNGGTMESCVEVRRNFRSV